MSARASAVSSSCSSSMLSLDRRSTSSSMDDMPQPTSAEGQACTAKGGGGRAAGGRQLGRAAASAVREPQQPSDCQRPAGCFRGAAPVLARRWEWLQAGAGCARRAGSPPGRVGRLLWSCEGDSCRRGARRPSETASVARPGERAQRRPAAAATADQPSPPPHQHLQRGCEFQRAKAYNRGGGRAACGGAGSLGGDQTPIVEATHNKGGQGGRESGQEPSRL